MKTLCLIPARGGSKRIPGKNRRLLSGKPLIAYTIEACVQASVFTECVVSSDDEDILLTAKEYGAKTDHRPQRLAGDSIKAVDVVLEYLQRRGHLDLWDAVAMCLPTCPFRTKEDLRCAVAMFEQEHERCPRLMAVTSCDFPPQLALFEKAPNLLDMREPDAYGFSTRSQDLGQLYYPNGAIYITTIKEFMHAKTFFGRPMLKYEMPPERSFDIDYEYQFRIAECMMQLRKEAAV